MKEVLGKTYSAGDDIVRQGEIGDCMFVIQEGEAEVLIDRDDGGQMRVDVMKAGEVFGEMAILERQTRSATVRAISPMRVLTIDKKTFLRRVQEDPSLAFMVLKAMSNRVRKLDLELAALKTEHTAP